MVAAVKATLHFIAPLALLSLAVFAPYLWVAWHTLVPTDPAALRPLFKAAWASLAFVGIAQLFLVGAAAGVARGTTQLRALACGARQLVRGAVPLAIALLAVIVGALALVLPGLALLALFSLAAGSDAPGLPAPLLESAEIVRRHWKRVAITLVAIAAVDGGLVYLFQIHVLALRYAALAIACVSPFAAAALSAIGKPSDASPAPAATPAAAPSLPD
jgi:hypothetical protein